MAGKSLAVGAGVAVGVTGVGSLVATVASLAGPAAAIATESLIQGAGILGVGGAVAVGALAAAKRLPRAPIEKRTADLFEGVRIEGELGDLLVAKDGTRIRVLRLAGVDYGSVTPEGVAQLERQRHDMWRDLAALGCHVTAYSRRESVGASNEADYAEPILQHIHDLWSASFSRVYVNEHYLILQVSGAHAPKVMVEATRRVVEGLDAWGPRVLCNDEPRSELLSFWASVLNGRPCEVAQASDNLGERLAAMRVGFNSAAGRVLFREDGRQFMAAAVSVKEWGIEDGPGMLRSIMQIPGRVEVLSHVVGFAQDTLVGALDLDRKQVALFYKSGAAGQDFATAIEKVASDEDSFLKYQLTVFVYGETEDELEYLLGVVRSIVKSCGHEAATEAGAIEYLWRSRLPAVRLFSRPRRLSAENLAGLMTWEAEPTGMASCDWGPGAIRLFRTRTGGPYALQLHTATEGPVAAHSLTVGGTGAGKTALWLHLAGGALRHERVSAYLFDSGQGCRVFCEAVSPGSYIHLGRREAGLNPLQHFKDKRDADFLNQWLRMLAADDSAEADMEANAALRMIRDVPAARRILRQSMDCFPHQGRLRSGLERWAAEDGVGALFNAERDTLDLTERRLFGFAMDDLFEVEAATAAAVGYIMHRIRQVAREGNRPHLVFIDEAPRLLSNPVFAAEAKKLLLEQRKARGSVNLAFQTVKSVFDTGIGHVIIESCPTFFLFPNESASWEDYKHLNLTEGQFRAIRRESRLTKHLRRWVMVKKGQETVILDTDLSCLGGALRVYRGGPDESLLMQQLQRQYGVERWVEELVNMD
ncbi:hypothetical protein ABMY26_07425 (plasmid) [Azospirillum sp. HJ39]|uniref:hypothetical protein n=1 Tax=Azospirillum sp. HJ39 TaxID=3159496 RepID=UPI003557F771